MENYRNAKGATYGRTVIYPTNDLKDYLKSKKQISSLSTKNSIYVALSRARNSVAIIYDGNIDSTHKIKTWLPE